MLAFMSELTHLDEHGSARMVDVGAKAVTERRALARAIVRMSPSGTVTSACGEFLINVQRNSASASDSNGTSSRSTGSDLKGVRGEG